MMAVHGVGKEILQEIKWADEVDESPGIPYVSDLLYFTWQCLIRRCNKVGPINLHQSMFENALRKNLEKLGTKVELGVELVRLEQSKDKVIARIKSEEGEIAQAFQYIVGADGARGMVSDDRCPHRNLTLDSESGSMRRLLGLSFLGETKESDKMFVANVECTDIDRTVTALIGTIDSISFFFVALASMGRVWREDVRVSFALWSHSAIG